MIHPRYLRAAGLPLCHQAVQVAIWRGFVVFPPFGEEALQVVIEERVQEMVAVKFADVLNVGEVEGHGVLSLRVCRCFSGTFQAWFLAFFDTCITGQEIGIPKCLAQFRLVQQ
jgi:hypothetical protein